MNLPDVQRAVASFVEANRLETSIEARLLDLTSEVGELAKEALRVTNYGRDQFQPNSEWVNELGDILFVLVCIANSTDVDLAEALNQSLAKSKPRLDATGDLGSGL